MFLIINLNIKPELDKEQRDMQDKSKKTAGIRLNFIIVLFLLSCGILALMPINKPDFLPSEILGTWTTAVPKYQGRFFELTEVYIVFGIGDNKVEIYFITDIKRTIDDIGVLYTVMAQNLKGINDKFSFYYKRERIGAIRLKNQQGILWTKSLK